MSRPRVFEWPFRVRFSECDPYGHVNHANYLRYMGEAALEASAAVGYSVERYRDMGRTWLIRESDITYIRPLTYGESAVVRTWVEDFRRVRSSRRYEIRLADSGELVATARSEWVYLDSQTSRPASVPTEMVTAFFGSDYAGGAGEKREPFPEPPPPPAGVVSLRLPVEWRDVDTAGHVNNANYLAYIEETNMRATAVFGWPIARIIDEGFGIVAANYRIEYLDSARLGDEMELTSYLSDVRRATAVRQNAVRRVSDGALLARARSLWAFVDLQTGRPIRIPAHFAADLRDNVTS